MLGVDASNSGECNSATPYIPALVVSPTVRGSCSSEISKSYGNGCYSLVHLENILFITQYIHIAGMEDPLGSIVLAMATAIDFMIPPRTVVYPL